MRHAGHTPTFRGTHGTPLPGSIAEVAYRRIGGVDQWVLIRGENIANPPLVFLHGGPGMSETGMLRRFNAMLESYFTVVYWDQRGAGKSFAPGIDRASMTIEQFIADLDELVDAVCSQLGKTKVVLLGHSWGSVLGVLYAARFPHKVAAYVGCAQMGDAPAGEAASYAYALAEAQRQGNRKAERKLRAIGPPPHDAAQLMTERTWVTRLDGGMRLKELPKTLRMLRGGPESSIFDVVRTMRGFRFSLDAMWGEVSRVNLLERVPALEMPVFFLLGRKDHWVMEPSSLPFVEGVRAPSKQVVWFEQSAHEIFVDEPAKFNATMIDVVRPVVTANDRAAW